MRSLTKILIAILLITSLIPVAVAVFCLFDHTKALEFFGLQIRSADLEKIFFVLAGFVLSTVVIPVLAVIWLIKGRPGGITLAYLAGFIALARGILTLIKFNSHNIHDTKLSATPIAIGLLILLLTFIASRQISKTTNAVEL